MTETKDSILTNRKFYFRTIYCPLCGSESHKVLGVKNGGYYQRNSDFELATIVRCRKCSLIYANPMPYPEEDDLSNLYSEDYVRNRMSSNYVPYRELQGDYVDIFEGKRRLKHLEKILGRKGNLLDIGCGPGNLLCVAKELGWEVKGLEVNKASASFASEVNGFEVHIGNIQDYAEHWKSHFDVVHFNQVLEHTYDPIGFLKTIRKILKENGVFFCGVPNEDSIMNRIAQLYCKFIMSKFTPMLSPTVEPYHVLGFSPRTIHAIFNKTGFRVLKIEHINYCTIDLSKLRNGELLRGIKSIIGTCAKFTGNGHGLDVYGILDSLN